MFFKMWPVFDKKSTYTAEDEKLDAAIEDWRIKELNKEREYEEDTRGIIKEANRYPSSLVSKVYVTSPYYSHYNTGRLKVEFSSKCSIVLYCTDDDLGIRSGRSPIPPKMLWEDLCF